MRVIMVTPGYYPIKGGTETVVRNLSIALNRKRVHTDIMTFNMDRKWNAKWRGKTEEIDGITVFRIPGLNWLPIAHSFRNSFGVNLIPGRFAHIFKRYDVVHFHELDFSFPLFSFLTRRPKILHLHGGIDFSLGVNLEMYGVITQLLLKHLPDFYISISRQMMRDLTFFGVSAEKIAYLPNAIDTRLFRPLGPKEDNLLLFVGRIARGKGLNVLLESLSYLEDPVRLVIIGPTDLDADYYQRLLKRIETEKRKGKHEIEVLGAKEQADIVSWYQRASIFILPSFREGFPVTSLEALSCETPVIATPVGGLRELVKNNKNGLLVPLNDPHRLAEAIQCLVESRGLRMRMGKEGREGIVRKFSLEVITERLLAFYEGILAG